MRAYRHCRCTHWGRHVVRSTRADEGTGSRQPASAPIGIGSGQWQWHRDAPGTLPSTTHCYVLPAASSRVPDADSFQLLTSARVFAMHGHQLLWSKSCPPHGKRAASPARAQPLMSKGTASFGGFAAAVHTAHGNMCAWLETCNVHFRPVFRPRWFLCISGGTARKQRNRTRNCRAPKITAGRRSLVAGKPEQRQPSPRPCVR